jgi:hypothetical protein
MNKYTIKYYYGSYSGVRIIFEDDEDSAISKMWKIIKKDMTLPMAYQSVEILNVEYNIYE